MDNKQTLALEEVKKIELNILKEFADFCEKNNLKYYLGYGTKKSKKKAIKLLDEEKEVLGVDCSDFLSVIDNAIKNVSK